MTRRLPAGSPVPRKEGRSTPRAGTHRSPFATGALVGIVLWFLVIPVALLAHQVLTASDPAADTAVDELPRELRLTFYEPVRLALTTVELSGPSGEPVSLAELRLSEDSDRVLVAEVTGTSDPGVHVVAWRTAGADGHAVQGRFGFEVLGPAAEPEAMQQVPTEARDDAGTLVHEVGDPGFTASSPLFVLIRWLTLGGLVVLLGALTFRWGVLPSGRVRSPTVGEISPRAKRDAATLGLVAGAALLLLAPVRLVLQAGTMTGGPASVDPETLRILATEGPWGAGWLLQVAGALGASLGFLAARAGRGSGWFAAAVAGLALAFSPALSGHAVGGGGGAVALHATHVVVAGMWLGGLAMLLLVGIPAARRLEDLASREATSALAGGFSLVATLGVALLFLTGAPAAFRLAGSFDALVGTSYGRVLLLKLIAVLMMGALGAYHALRIRPRLAGEGAVQRLRRTGALEVGAGIVVLLLTAVLVALPLPR